MYFELLKSPDITKIKCNYNMFLPESYAEQKPVTMPLAF